SVHDPHRRCLSAQELHRHGAGWVRQSDRRADRRPRARRARRRRHAVRSGELDVGDRIRAVRARVDRLPGWRFPATNPRALMPRPLARPRTLMPHIVGRPFFWIIALVIAVFAIAPLIGNDVGLRESLILAAVYITLASNLNLMLGHTGYVNFGSIV